MKQLVRSALVFFSFIFTLSLFAQRTADIGVRLNTSDYNKMQLEFRKPVGEQYSFRLTGSMGFSSSFPWNNVHDANDSVVTTRNSYWSGSYYDLRFGVERKLKWNNFSMHSDLILGYSETGYNAWNSYSVKDSSNNWNAGWQYNMQNDAFSSSRDRYFSTGLALGVSFDYPLTRRFILNLNANYVAMARFNVDHQEQNDFLDEYYDGGGTLFELYPSVGVGIRYSLGEKE